jgi:hypothetical protein
MSFQGKSDILNNPISVDFEVDKITISTNFSSAKISLRSNIIMLNLIFISDLIDILNLGRFGGN